jgi:magnesium transporter
MITAYISAEGILKKAILSGSPNLAVRDAQAPADLLPTHVQAIAEHAADELSPASVWVDLCDPTPAEIASVERVFGIEIPTREEMHEIEASSRLYTENGFLVMTAPILHRASAEIPESGTVTFILLPGTLVTVRFVDPLPFAVFARRAERNPTMAISARPSCWGCWKASPTAWPTCWNWRRWTWSGYHATSSPPARRQPTPRRSRGRSAKVRT